ncbi:hypothetical protein KRX57_03630 [Weeksellaceae bacterium TAE3-ERU29]|nr:hypothetical protein [Weeksellaceae bacterium TAE3-ERU29]
MEYLYNRPVINVQKISEIIEKAPSTAYKLTSDLEKLEILKEITGADRGRLYMFEDYVSLFRQ